METSIVDKQAGEMTGKGCIVEVKSGLVFGGVHEFKLVHELDTLTFPVGDAWASYTVPVGVAWRGEIIFRALDIEVLREVVDGAGSLIRSPDDLPARFAFYGVLRGHDTGSAHTKRCAVYLADCQPTGEVSQAEDGSFTVSFMAHNRTPSDVVFYLPPNGGSR